MRPAHHALLVLVLAACASKEQPANSEVATSEASIEPNDEGSALGRLGIDAGFDGGDALDADANGNGSDSDASAAEAGTGSGSVSAEPFARPSRVVPRVRLGKASITGQLDRQIVRRFVRNAVAGFRACYQRQLQKNPKLEGTLTLSFVIDVRGQVKAARASGLHTRVDACVAKRASKIAFPHGNWDGTVYVKYPISFGVTGRLR